MYVSKSDALSKQLSDYPLLQQRGVFPVTPGGLVGSRHGAAGACITDVWWHIRTER